MNVIYQLKNGLKINLNVKIFVNEGSNIRSPMELKDKKVATLRGSFYEFVLKKEPNINLVLFDTELEGLKTLKEGKVDAFVGGDITTYHRIKEKGIKAVGSPLHMKILYFAVKKGDDRLLNLSCGLKGGKDEKASNNFPSIYDICLLSDFSLWELRCSD